MIEKEFPGANIVMAKRGKLPKVRETTWEDKVPQVTPNAHEVRCRYARFYMVFR